MKEVPRWGGYTVNLIHYEDAAGITMSVSQSGGQCLLSLGARGKVAKSGVGQSGRWGTSS